VCELPCRLLLPEWQLVAAELSDGLLLRRERERANVLPRRDVLWWQLVGGGVVSGGLVLSIRRGGAGMPCRLLLPRRQQHANAVHGGNVLERGGRDERPELPVVPVRLVLPAGQHHICDVSVGQLLPGWQREPGGVRGGNVLPDRQLGPVGVRGRLLLHCRQRGAHAVSRGLLLSTGHVGDDHCSVPRRHVLDDSWRQLGSRVPDVSGGRLLLGRQLSSHVVSCRLLLRRGQQHTRELPCWLVLPGRFDLAGGMSDRQLLQPRRVGPNAVPRRRLLQRRQRNTDAVRRRHFVLGDGRNLSERVPSVRCGYVLPSRQHLSHVVPGGLLLWRWQRGPDELPRRQLLRWRQQRARGVRQRRVLPRIELGAGAVPCRLLLHGGQHGSVGVRGRHLLERVVSGQRVVVPGVSGGLLLPGGQQLSDRVPCGQLLSRAEQRTRAVPGVVLLPGAELRAAVVSRGLLLPGRQHGANRVPRGLLLPGREHGPDAVRRRPVLGLNRRHERDCVHAVPRRQLLPSGQHVADIVSGRHVLPCRQLGSVVVHGGLLLPIEQRDADPVCGRVVLPRRQLAGAGLHRGQLLSRGHIHTDRLRSRLVQRLGQRQQRKQLPVVPCRLVLPAGHCQPAAVPRECVLSREQLHACGVPRGLLLRPEHVAADSVPRWVLLRRACFGSRGLSVRLVLPRGQRVARALPSRLLLEQSRRQRARIVHAVPGRVVLPDAERQPDRLSWRLRVSVRQRAVQPGVRPWLLLPHRQRWHDVVSSRFVLPHWQLNTADMSRGLLLPCRQHVRGGMPRRHLRKLHRQRQCGELPGMPRGILLPVSSGCRFLVQRRQLLSRRQQLPARLHLRGQLTDCVSGRRVLSAGRVDTDQLSCGQLLSVSKCVPDALCCRHILADG
jgi:hypothetical protein